MDVAVCLSLNLINKPMDHFLSRSPTVTLLGEGIIKDCKCPSEPPSLSQPLLAQLASVSFNKLTGSCANPEMSSCFQATDR